MQTCFPWLKEDLSVVLIYFSVYFPPAVSSLTFGLQTLGDKNSLCFLMFAPASVRGFSL